MSKFAQTIEINSEEKQEGCYTLYKYGIFLHLYLTLMSFKTNKATGFDFFIHVCSVKLMAGVNVWEL